MKKIELNPFGVLLCFIGLTILCFLIFAAFGVAVAADTHDGFSLSAMSDPSNLDILKENKSALILIQSISTIGGFLLPGILVSTFFEGYSLKKVGHLARAKPALLFLCATVIFYGAIITIGLLHEINQLFPISAYWKIKEVQVAAQQKALIQGTGIKDLLTSIVVVALLPALLEEFTFRGIALHIFDRTIGNKHVAILFQGIIFAFIHMNMGQLLPILGMGILFGYIAYESKSIWYTVLIHFLNNSLAVFALFYANQHGWAKKMSEDTAFPHWQYALGVVILTAGLYFFFKYVPKIKAKGQNNIDPHLNQFDYE